MTEVLYEEVLLHEVNFPDSECLKKLAMNDKESMCTCEHQDCCCHGKFVGISRIVHVHLDPQSILFSSLPALSSTSSGMHSHVEFLLTYQKMFSHISHTSHHVLVAHCQHYCFDHYHHHHCHLCQNSHQLGVRQTISLPNIDCLCCPCQSILFLGAGAR